MRSEKEILQDSFDYTEWQRNLFENITVKQIFEEGREFEKREES